MWHCVFVGKEEEVCVFASPKYSEAKDVATKYARRGWFTQIASYRDGKEYSTAYFLPED
jgi:hypothetical protein